MLTVNGVALVAIITILLVALLVLGFGLISLCRLNALFAGLALAAFDSFEEQRFERDDEKF